MSYHSTFWNFPLKSTKMSKMSYLHDIQGQNFAQKMSEMSYFSTFWVKISLKNVVFFDILLFRVVGSQNVENDVFFDI